MELASAIVTLGTIRAEDSGAAKKRIFGRLDMPRGESPRHP